MHVVSPRRRAESRRQGKARSTSVGCVPGMDPWDEEEEEDTSTGNWDPTQSWPMD